VQNWGFKKPRFRLKIRGKELPKTVYLLLIGEITQYSNFGVYAGDGGGIRKRRRDAVTASDAPQTLGGKKMEGEGSQRRKK